MFVACIATRAEETSTKSLTRQRIETQNFRRAVRAPFLILCNNLLSNCNIIIFVFIQIIYFIFVKILHVRLTVFKVSSWA